jgi:hypothetical protein
MATTKTASIGASVSRQASEVGAEVSSELGRVDRELRAFVKERPVLALLSAIAAGYMLGRVIRRLA